jgi:hypothetical protein
MLLLVVVNGRSVIKKETSSLFAPKVRHFYFNMLVGVVKQNTVWLLHQDQLDGC